MDKKISIIVPIYNSEKYLEKCIDSIINQTYKNLEIILINDGSKDNSKKICEEYAKLDKRIIFINNNNNGVSETRNIGINISTGSYIMFVDSDDYLSINACSALISNAKDDVDVIFGKMVRVNNGKLNYNNYIEKQNKLYKDNDIKLFKKSILGFLPKEEKIVFPYNEGPVAKLYKSSVIKDNNINFDKNISIGEDGLFNFELYSKCKKIMFINENIYFYYQNSSSAMNIIDRKKIDSYFNLFKIYDNLINEEYYDNLNIFITKQMFRICNNYIYSIDKNLSQDEFEKLTNDKYVKRIKTSNLNKYNLKYKLTILLLNTNSYFLNKVYYKVIGILFHIKKVIK